jgi:TPR repeat protein
MRFLLVSLLLMIASAASAERKAFVVGNDSYRYVTAVENARNDARAIGEVLTRAGFSVMVVEDADRQTLVEALGRFAQSLDADDDAFVFYAGHGVQVEGRNFLLPVDIEELKSETETTIEYASIEVNSMLGVLKRTGAQSIILILDACRNNPFPVEGSRAAGVAPGLAIVAPPRGVFVLYSADEGELALSALGDDDKDPNSVFTRVLLRHLKIPGQTVEELANAVQGEVNDLAATIGHNQFPTYYDRLAGQLVLVPDPCARAAERFAGLGETPEAAALIGFLEEFPDCKGYDGAMLDLGVMYQTGNGVAQDDAEAVRWYRAAARAGNVEGMLSLGMMYETGTGVAPNDVKALRWFRSAAEAGNAAGMTKLGISYQSGRGVAPSLAEAERWFRAAAEAGDARGMFNLATMYFSGEGVAQDYAEAVRWYRAAAEAGDADAMRSLGAMYRTGDGVRRNRAEAERWFAAAEAAGN